MANEVLLQEGHPVDENFRPLKVGGKATSIETAQSGNGARITGKLELTNNLNVAGNIKGNDILSSDLTIDDSGDITLDPDGDLIVSGAAVKIGAGYKLYLDGGGDTYIDNPDTDVMRFSAGGDTLLELNESGDNGNLVSFGSSAAGFSKIEETFSDDSIIGSGGAQDTHFDFRHSNKISCLVTADFTNANLIFPAVSGNFLLLLTYDGDHDVTNWKVYDREESAATTTDVMWAGGSVPATTDSGVDIFSFFWDASRQACYGVASLAFATP